jgi:hypothetical protein
MIDLAKGSVVIRDLWRLSAWFDLARSGDLEETARYAARRAV